MLLIKLELCVVWFLRIYTFSDWLTSSNISYQYCLSVQLCNLAQPHYLYSCFLISEEARFIEQYFYITGSQTIIWNLCLYRFLHEYMCACIDICLSIFVLNRLVIVPFMKVNNFTIQTNLCVCQLLPLKCFKNYHPSVYWHFILLHIYLSTLVSLVLIIVSRLGKVFYRNLLNNLWTIKSPTFENLNLGKSNFITPKLEKYTNIQLRF